MPPQSIKSLGDSKVATGTHLKHVIETYPKSMHNLTMKSIDLKDKQNYSSVALLVSDEVESCLKQLKKFDTTGTVTYANLMRCVRNSFFDKDISPLERIDIIWFSVFMCRIWHSWLKN